MKSKKLATYLIGAVTGVGLAISTMAFAQNTLDHGGMMGQTTQQTTQGTMHGQAAPQTTAGGMHGQAVKNKVPAMHGDITTHHAGADHFNSKTHCNSATGNQDKKS